MLTKPRSIPTYPGIYVFWLKRTPLYIGKAANLKQRLASYFQKRAALPMKIQRMLQEATRLETIETASEIEALLKEAELIKKHRPKYNLLMRDDKSYFYVAITREEFPRIFVTHQPKLEIRNPKFEIRSKSQIRNSKRVSDFVLRASDFRYIGPFTSGTALKAVLKLLRRVFPYCTCKRPHKRPCLNAEIGRCPGYCCATGACRGKRIADRERREYRKNIRNMIAVLEGKRTRLIGRLKREMKEAVKRERYEEAARLRDAIFGLEDIFAHRKVLHAPEMRPVWPTAQAKLQALLKTNRDIRRIEGYDISNISGQEATGSMVVFANGEPDKSQYRKFRIKTVSKISDVDMLKEVISRRFRHAEWPYPDLIIVDGGKPQLHAVHRAIGDAQSQNSVFIYDRKYKRSLPIMTALAKREETLFAKGQSRPIRLRQGDPAVLHLFQRIRDEAHRFARAYHHKLRKKVFKRNV